MSVVSAGTADGGHAADGTISPGGVHLERLALNKPGSQCADPPPTGTPPPTDVPSRPGVHMVHWFRKGLRLHDNPALREGLRGALTFRCIFIIDPWFAGSSNVGINKWRFLLQCLEDLDDSLRKLNSRLFVIRGQPADALPKLFREWGTTALSFEEDPEPFGRVRDHNITAMCRDVGIEVVSRVSHTLYKLDKIIEHNGGRAPLTYHQFQALVANLPLPPPPEATVTASVLGGAHTPLSRDHDDRFGVPTLEELGFDTEGIRPPVWIGGEKEALARLDRHLERKAWVASFGRPKMTPQSLLASHTGLSPYLRFGCLSTRLFYYQLTELYKRIKHARPPLSLHGQLLWREFFYCAATRNPNFDRMVGNPICVQIPWDKNPEALAKWANAQTGYPWIDAVMTQLREEGWIHHLARHAVACFLTRGDLWLSWEEGMKVFEELLLDADWSVNAGMWMWLSCSSFFQQFFHCYCPVRFGRKADPNGDFIKKYLPVLANMPTIYIHEPWNAPTSVQCAARCVVGRDYPLPMVDHNHASQLNVKRIKQVYQHLAKYRDPSMLTGQQSAVSVQSHSPTTVITHVNQSNYLSNINSDYTPNKYKPHTDDYCDKRVPDIFQKQEQNPHVHKSIPFKHVVIIQQPMYKDLCDETQSLKNYSEDKRKPYRNSDVNEQPSVIEYNKQKSQNYTQNVEYCNTYNEMRNIMVNPKRQYGEQNESDRNVIQHNNTIATSGKTYNESNSKYYMQPINNSNNLEFDSSMDGSQFASYPQDCYNNQGQYGNYADVGHNSYEGKSEIPSGKHENYKESIKQSPPFNNMSGPRPQQFDSGKLCCNEK